MTRVLTAFILVLGLTVLPGCYNQDNHLFFIESGPAGESLKAFAEQSGENVVFDETSIQITITNEVSGKMPAEDALRMLLSGTELNYYYDEYANLYRIRLKNFSQQ